MCSTTVFSPQGLQNKITMFIVTLYVLEALCTFSKVCCPLVLKEIETCHSLSRNYCVLSMLMEA